MPLPNSIDDKQHQSFVQTPDDKTARRVYSDYPFPVNPAGVDYDTINATYPTNTTEIYEYLKDSVLLLRLTVIYTAANKNTLLSVTREVF